MRDDPQVRVPGTGDAIGDAYVLGDRLGCGGMGVVYCAVQRSLDRLVAVKLPHLELRADPLVRRRFRNEALAGSRVRHRNIVHVLDYNEAGDAPYLVMEHVAGPPLGVVLADRGRLPVAMAADLVGQVLAALEEAHACGVIHGDIKPDNVLVETLRDGTTLARLVDFGLARFADTEPERAADGEPLVSGTPEYLAPELVRGEAPSSASDIYAAAVTLYELIAGQTPFAGGSRMQIASRHLDTAALPLASRCPDAGVPEALDAAIARALAKCAGDRFETAHAFRSAIERALRDDAVAMTAAPTLEVEALSPVDVCRAALRDALAGGSDNAIVVAYLDLARAHVDAHQLAPAIVELETGIVRLGANCAALWRLQLSLAALYDGCGERTRARRATREAQLLSARAGSTLGYERASRLLAWLERGAPRTAHHLPSG